MGAESQVKKGIARSDPHLEHGTGGPNRQRDRQPSGGQRQALTLLMASWLKPELLLLDEHTGVSHAAQPGLLPVALARPKLQATFTAVLRTAWQDDQESRNDPAAPIALQSSKSTRWLGGLQRGHDADRLQSQ